jgi:hypothetical protein
LDTIASRKKMLVPPLLAQPLDELRQQQVQGGQDRREALRKTNREARVGSRLFLFIEKNLIEPRAEIKLSIRDPSDIQIKHVNSKTVAFR